MITWSVEVGGRFQDALHLTGEQTFTVTCAGTLCGLDSVVLGYELPCVYTVAFHATAAP